MTPQTVIFGILLVSMLFWVVCGAVIGYLLRGALQQRYVSAREEEVRR